MNIRGFQRVIYHKKIRFLQSCRGYKASEGGRGEGTGPNRGVAVRQARKAGVHQTPQHPRQAIHLAYAHSTTISLRRQRFSLRSLLLRDPFLTDGRQGRNSWPQAARTLPAAQPDAPQGHASPVLRHLFAGPKLTPLRFLSKPLLYLPLRCPTTAVW
ncbi:hypothetical protein P171DRAFT_85506 [Karstenula rhodostoma CBS 690.94]|uniref:Uncharacterized protein n=1 Tax=Karstenula rhodostoma CBS 690.94 TaxID=1392251 RepID=A0A9P4U978_9PLEO|nr:hypothetical protein P171DRAFT_85506 [Karstenula rhodostoma CBS 690.94]